ncbi:MAG TPA: DUF3078 domain-containing protein [Fermentimonas caenicola]|jgi:hypothetical protein|uniref:Secreted protein n=1 Tax=Fermentimonas caenicola TaxID=1562970 RepID=A0A098BY49_9BACT|nr:MULTISPECIES: DUF3078 domain-containing protein [Lascolabacillus]TAH60735.1 MAG: DUF3078 domain-containing protein [Fermentimonas caenicola]MCK9500611.1 DUF3078 domain-containing protein [Lascolabacillus sp.]MDD3658463.1 DUF3078 domain-containing protein [Lascolabacillus sp.]MDD4758634.1 DUF3078 domain-containing protein [Lascolabacillus sp.]CEA15078.1 hypothetical protein ING2E5B_0309 [Fermentimonas caenicola]
MKQLFLSLIISVFSLSVTAADLSQVNDSLDLFEDITDISRLIQNRTTHGEIIVNDTILPKERVTDYVIPAQVIQPVLPVSRNPLDSIYVRNERGILQLPENYYNPDALRGLTFRDTLFYNPLFLPMIFNGRMLPRDISFYNPDKDYEPGKLIDKDKTFEPRLERSDFIQKIRRNYYTDHPDRVKYSILNFESLPQVATDDEIVRETFNPFRELLRSETAYSLEAPGVELTTINRKYWVRSGEHSFQFAQNYFSDNWHKGGTNNLNFNSYHVLRANYKKDKVRFNNTLEWRLSVFNAPDDSLREYRIGNDLIRYYGDFGLDAFAKGWSYSMNMEAKSQLFNSYPTNSNQLRSALLSPLYVNAGVGLKFNLDKKSEKVRGRRVRWDLALAPISLNFKYVSNDSVDVVRFGIPENKKYNLDMGTTVTSILKYDITRYITWDSRLTYFTSYDKVEAEFENSLNMALSNAFSTRIYLNVRFDDGVPPHPDLKYLQYNQTLSFGLNYKW